MISWHKIIPIARWMMSRVGVLYVLVFILLATTINFQSIGNRIKVRRLNDTRPVMSSLVRFNEGKITADKVEWAAYIKYFNLVVKYMPDEKIARMFLGFCEYYSGDSSQMAWSHIERAADEPPLVYWGAYNAGIMAFERKDFEKAILFLDRALRLPTDIALKGIASSVIYRQLMASPEFHAEVSREIDDSREDLYLFLSASYYYNKDFEKSKNVALYAIHKTILKNPKPFYFYAGASSLAMNQKEEALAFFGQCLIRNSSNPLVYWYAAEILKSTGADEDAAKLIYVWQSLKDKQTSWFPYAKRIRLRIY